MTALKIVLTGATGGIGSAMAQSFARAGHRLILLGRNSDALAALQGRLQEPSRHQIMLADLSSAATIASIAAKLAAMGEIDVLINNAGLSDFGLVADLQDDAIAQMLQVNLLAPMRLCRALLPLLSSSGNAAIINIGSSFGSIGYPGFSAYCASKFGLRGFTEVLQRELADQPIAVHYLAPRAVRTTMNSPAVMAMNKELGNREDEPEIVAAAALQLLTQRRSSSRYLGWPEKLFVRLNALLPNVVANALKKQLPTIRRYATQHRGH
ncbi:SDR family oxidoreductase [Zhongshania guokunii]|uniref:SDR family oxidoreductase n=1 Tax=Zhongshania guokunii TaxID=641783 RepID=A0ABV3U7D0_9GAMM